MSLSIKLRLTILYVSCFHRLSAKSTFRIDSLKRYIYVIEILLWQLGHTDSEGLMARACSAPRMGQNTTVISLGSGLKPSLE